MAIAIPSFLHRTVLLVGSVAILSGCAGVYRVDSQVESFARWTARDGAHLSAPMPPQTYRFERLPSKTAGSAAESQDLLEQSVEVALKPLGWTQAVDASSAPWAIEVSAQGVRLPYAPWEDPRDGAGFGWSGHVQIGIGRGAVLWSPWLLRSELPYYERRVTLVIRDTANGRVAYETRAAHDGRWNSTPSLWRAMIDAALEDFPAPPNGARQVNRDVPR